MRKGVEGEKGEGEKKKERRKEIKPGRERKGEEHKCRERALQKGKKSTRRGMKEWKNKTNKKKS